VFHIPINFSDPGLTRRPCQVKYEVAFRELGDKRLYGPTFSLANLTFTANSLIAHVDIRSLAAPTPKAGSEARVRILGKADNRTFKLVYPNLANLRYAD
jgi:hypothetical protein